MTARSLFHIIIKVIGIWLIKDVVIALPTLVGVIYDFARVDVGTGITTLLFSLLMLFLYGVLIFNLLFRTDFVIDKLKLAERVPEDPVPLNIHRSTVLTIVILLAGIMLIAQGIPLLIRELTQWYQYNRANRGFFGADEPFDYSLLLVYAAQVIIGLLFIGNQRALVNFIELRQRGKTSREPGAGSRQD